MSPRVKAYLVHYLTATGAVWAILALLEAVQHRWDIMFLWLVVALIVDGIDGPLARKYDVATHAPRFDGVILDLIIDFLTYVVIPAYALFASGLLAGWTGWAAIIVIMFTSALYYCDNNMKTEDKSFNGFPGCWNMVILMIFAIEPNHWVILAIVAFLSAAMFLPLRFIHPTRTQRWKVLSLTMSILWIVFAMWSAWGNFAAQSWAPWGLVVTSAYLLFAGIAQQIIPEKNA